MGVQVDISIVESIAFETHEIADGIVRAGFQIEVHRRQLAFQGFLVDFAVRNLLLRHFGQLAQARQKFVYAAFCAEA